MGDDFRPQFVCLRGCVLPAFAVRRLSDFRSSEATIASVLFGAVCFGCAFFFFLKSGQRQTFCPRCVAASTSQHWSTELALPLDLGKPKSCQRAFVALCVYSWIKNTASMIFPFVEWIIRAHAMPRIISHLGSSVEFFFFLEGWGGSCKV